ncbi:hypothetical protein BDY21DRAFT_308968 [Lineolata rhizophorae]|uniref:Uncharacterized protein n=1 Tax=Lineolata rhizophorae TaxID=578093 RepID=A0A6A6NRW5_9PEZI|nr:hypothetical protein BDY21DRAFT_308968 [Lineolata rhizophorae]
MDNGEPRTEYEGIAAAFAKAKAVKEKEEAQGLRENTADNKRAEVQFKASHGLLVAFFVWILLLHVFGIYLFTSGFLLTRLVLEEKSKCDFPPIPLTQGYESGSTERGCWHPKSFDKAVVVIVDALRYDFTVPFRPTPEDKTPHHFHNALPIFHEIASQQPNNAFLLPFIADPPTTTLQRLKGLTTGTLPTFIDAGSNFAGTAISEDNLVAQLRDAGKHIVHLGDDTWHSLFPGYFEPDLTRAYDSFNVWDLHTVDNGVNEHLFPLMHPSNSSRWDVIFGHYLGLDHAGHRYGPDHPATAAKLQQMDEVFRRLIDALDDDTLLVVMGDHGMDAKGDHGGESDDEIQAALWMYSKQPRFGRSSPNFVEPPPNAKTRPVPQIDLVPTLSLLLGLPIPFNNLGAPIEEAFIGASGHDYENMATVARLASAQVHLYQYEYSVARGLEASATSLPKRLWAQANTAWNKVKYADLSISIPEDYYRDAYASFHLYQTETLAVCRGLWARFDVPAMAEGIAVLVAALAVLGVYARGLTGDRAEVTPALVLRGSVGTLLGAAIGACVGYVISDMPFIQVIVLGAATGSFAGIALGFHYVRRRLQNPFPTTFWGALGVVFTLMLSVGFAANSFTIWEDAILPFYLATCGALFFARALRRRETVDRALGAYHSVLFIILTRVSHMSRLCREEQMPYCKSTYYASATSSTSAWWQLLIPFMLAIALPSIIRSYYVGTRSYQSSAPFWIGLALRAGLTLAALYWLLDAADDGGWFDVSNDAMKTARVFVAQVVLAIAYAAGYSTFAWSPPLLSIQSTPQPIVANGGASSIGILGYANVHGTRYFILVTLWALAIILVQKPMGGGAIGLCLWQILSLLEMLDATDMKASSAAIGPVVLALLGSFHYFTTGHQATLASIQWESAFVPLKAIRYPWSPLLVALNTFGAQILCAVAVPATVLWKVPPKQKGLLGDVAKATATHLLVYSAIGLATSMWAGHLRRHLMLYRIFNPRFMMGGVVLLVVDVVCALVALGGTRWSFLSVAEVFGW